MIGMTELDSIVVDKTVLRVGGGRGAPTEVGQLRFIVCADAKVGSESVPSH